MDAIAIVLQLFIGLCPHVKKGDESWSKFIVILYPNRVCHCNKYKNRENLLRDGFSSEIDGYEVHYSQKCKWKAYDDFKTGKRVLIRLCKCYKPVTHY